VLRRIAAVRAIDTVRRRSRDRRTFVPIGDANPPDARQRPPHEGAIVAELLDDLRAALAHLPEPQATAFVLTQLEDVAHGEAARTLGVTVNHVGVLLHRARAALRGRMNHHLNSDTREARR
jgi:RNA polymerase sigma-70 factor (ECF subfamily)